MSHVPITRALAAALVSAAAIAGCAGKKARQAAALTAPTRSELPATAPAVRGTENGMEMMWWGVSAGSKTLAELLAPYLADESVPLDPRTRTLWQANGLRLVAVPLDELERIRQLLPQNLGVQRQWIGQVSAWTDVIHGTPWHDLQPVDMDNGRLNLGPGQLRVLLRCWSIPVPATDAADSGIRAAMRAELLLQHQEPGRVKAEDLFTRPTDVSNPLDAGLVFRRLAASLTLPRDRALLVVPESPHTDWRALAQLPLAEISDPSALAETRPPEPASSADDPPGVGQVLRDRQKRREQDQSQQQPAVPESAGPIDATAEFARTLGELLLVPNRARLEGTVADKPLTRSILVLAPRIPERFSIEPGVPAALPGPPK